MSVVLGAVNKDVRASVSVKMLDKGFSMVKIGAAPVVIQTASYTAQIDTTPKQTSVSNYQSGTTGVQFGAFSSRGAAVSQQSRIRNLLGVNTYIETAPNGMYRVRINGLSDSSAKKIKSDAANAGIDSYIF